MFRFVFFFFPFIIITVVIVLCSFFLWCLLRLICVKYVYIRVSLATRQQKKKKSAMGRWDERLTEDGKKGARCVSVRMNRYHIHGCSFIECWTRMCTRTGNQADRWERGGNNRNNKRCEFLRSKANIAIASKCTVESVIFYLFNAFVRRFMLCIWLRAYFFPRLFFWNDKWCIHHCHSFSSFFFPFLLSVPLSLQ